MKNRYISYVFLSLLSLCLAGCYADKGNYDYVDINKVNVYLSCGGSYTITIGETISIKAEISFPEGNGDRDRLEFQWYLGNYPDDAVEGWNSPELEWTPDELMSKKTLLLEVHDPVTGIRYFAGTQITVQAIYDAYGVLVLSEKENGKSMLSYIKWKPDSVADVENLEPSASMENGRDARLMRSYTEYPDVFFAENGTDLPEGPVSIHEHFCADKTSVAQLLILTRNGAVDISGKTFKVDPIGSLDKVFADGKYPDGMDYVKEARFMTRVDLVTDQDGHIYTRIRNTNQLFHSGRFLTNRLQYLGEEEVSDAHLYMHPYSISPNACIVHDNNAKRLFFVCDTGASVEWDLQEGDVAAGHSFAISDPTKPSSQDGTEAMYVKASDLSAADEIISVGYSAGWPVREYTSTFVLFKRDGRYFLEEMWIARTNLGRGNFEFNVTRSRIEEIKGLPGDPVDLYISPYVYYYANPYIMLAVGNQVYVYDLENRTLPASAYFTEPLRADIVSLSGEDRYYLWWLALGLSDGSVVVVNTRNARYTRNRMVLYDSKKQMYN
ncbi:MAG: PKD-like family lipoprotein, partial [Candidatus Cryptobacteroides sp.]